MTALLLHLLLPTTNNYCNMQHSELTGTCDQAGSQNLDESQDWVPAVWDMQSSPMHVPSWPLFFLSTPLLQAVAQACHSPAIAL